MDEKKKKKVGFWKKNKEAILMTMVTTIISLIIGAIFYPINKKTEDMYDNNPCEIDDCTIVITSFNDASEDKNYLPNLFVRVLSKKLNIKTTPCPIDDRSKINDAYITGDFKKKNITGVPQVIISGNFSPEGILTIDIFERDNGISKKLGILQSSIEVEVQTPEHLESRLEEAGIFIAIMHSFNDPNKCDNNFIRYRDSITYIYQTKINNRATMEVIGESYYQENNFDQADKNFSLAISLDSNHISNYARRALVKDTLNKFEGAFTDYTHYITNFERSNNQLISNYKVRNSRLKMINKVLRLNDESIFNDNFSKKMIKVELKKDIEFYQQNKNDSLGTDKMILDTDQTIKILNESYIKVTGRVKDNFNVPIYQVKIKDDQNVDSTWTDNQGRYTINLPANSKLIFSKNGYESKNNVVPANDTINITLQHKMKEIKGKVSIGVNPIQGVRIKGYKDQYSTLTNQSGNYSLSVPEITSNLSATHQSFHDQSVTIGNGSTLNFSLVPKKIGGTVRNDLYKLKDALVSIRGTQSKTRTTNGTFELSVPSRSNTLDISIRRYKPQSIPINQENYIITLEDSLRIVALKVFRNQNTVISNVKVYYNGNHVGTSNNQGRISVRIPIRGVTLRFEHADYSTIRIAIPDDITNFTEGVKLNLKPPQGPS